jgi:hypothetical protein
MRLIAAWVVLIAAIGVAGAPGPWNSGRAPAWNDGGDCAACHQAEAAFIANTGHRSPKTTCIDCHTVGSFHDEGRRHEPPLGSTLRDMQTCRTCHTSSDLAKIRTVSREMTGHNGKPIGFAFSHEAHAQSMGHDCASCHSGSTATPYPISCAACHVDAIHGPRDRSKIPVPEDLHPGSDSYTRCSPSGLARCGACHHGAASESKLQHANGRWDEIPNMSHHHAGMGSLIRSCDRCHPGLK